MPYIHRGARPAYDKIVDELVYLLCPRQSPGIRKGPFNYVMFTLALKLAHAQGIGYVTLQDIVGTFECCKQEFIRRVVSPYEDGAIQRHGDVPGTPKGD